jgi:deoxyribose-phosphate aldolase
MYSEIAKTIDHTLLKPDATEDMIKQLCFEAKENQFATVCVNPSFVQLAANELVNSSVGVCTVIGFPLGASQTSVKAFETIEAIKSGATEVDMVINIGSLKSRDLSLVKEDIVTVVQAAGNVPVKVIIETTLLNQEEKVQACKIAESAGASFVKTSTGFAGGGATFEDIQLMRKTVSDNIKIKASGGIRDIETANKMIELGANRLGTSSGVKILKGLKSESNY